MITEFIETSRRFYFWRNYFGVRHFIRGFFIISFFSYS
ncbi:hypothetical protein ADIS_4279 [Lunatimonas lonarensis]|uniref:Uncharacterized protein n=1 Tax=Lunatimonas lonarensis TaxID=1232681 RepID=R7ZLY9_9BACT|nr:hypothetical protein ADIS_4279 [Lunatimonas lonarensis]